MAGITFGILNGILTKGWLPLVAFPIAFAILAGLWKAFRGETREDRATREQMISEGRDMHTVAQVPYLEAAWQGLLALAATGATVVVRHLML